MSRLVLDFDADNTRRHLVYVGDSIGYTAADGDTQNNMKRLPSLLAKSVCERGFEEWDLGFDGTQYPGNKYWRWDGTADGLAENTSNTPYDWNLYFLTDAGQTATNWPDGDKSFDLEVASYGDDHHDILVVQFGWNDFSAPDSAATFESGLEARLNEWTDVDRKFLLPGYLPYSASYERGAIREDASAAAYWTAINNAAADANPGNQQDTVAVAHLGGYSQGTGMRNSLPLSMLRSDATHPNRVGAQFMARSLVRHPDWPGVRIPY